MPLGREVCPTNGESITNERDLTLYLDTQTEVGQTVQVAVWRDGRELILAVTLAERLRWQNHGPVRAST